MATIRPVRSLAAAARALVGDLDPAADAAPLHLLAVGTRLAGDYDGAANLYQESLELNQRLGDERGIGMEHHNLGHVELHRGNVDAAERHFASSDASRNRDDPYEQAMMHLNLAAIVLARAKPGRAHDELERSTSILDTAGITLDPDDAFEVGWLRDQLGRLDGPFQPERRLDQSPSRVL